MDVVVTWPKSRTLDSYVFELAKAKDENKVINFRVANKPDADTGDRCYMVHDGYVQGWNKILEVRRSRVVVNVITEERMASGLYIVRDPEWHPITPFPMKGFQGFRYAKPYTCERCGFDINYDGTPHGEDIGHPADEYAIEACVGSGGHVHGQR